MQLHSTSKLTTKTKKRLGRGTSSGKGKTSARGQKGQKARENVALGFIGGTLPLYKKLPFRRGLGNAKVSPKMLVVEVSKLEVLAADSEVDLQSLIAAKIVSEKDGKNGVKIVGVGELSIPLTVKLPASKSAKSQIEKAGGKVV